MSFFDLFNNNTITPSVPSILPDVARQQILRGQLPILQPNNLFLKRGEVCHYVDRAIYEKKTVNKRRIKRNSGRSVSGLFRGTRIHMGSSTADTVEDVKYFTIKGILYITTKRIIFIGSEEGFDRKVDDLIAVTPYANCVEFQFSTAGYEEDSDFRCSTMVFAFQTLRFTHNLHTLRLIWIPGRRGICCLFFC